MEQTHRLFLQALRAALKSEEVTWDQVSPEEWHRLFRLAQSHHLLPLFLEAVHSCPAIGQADPALIESVRHSVRVHVMQQTIKTADFLALFQKLLDRGVTPMVVKGIVCRELYPKPDLRISGDEDVLIPREQYHLCRRIMQEFHMAVADENAERNGSYEIPFRKVNGPLYIELHLSLFSEQSDAYGDFNRYFEGVNQRAVTLQIADATVRTLCPTDHIFFLFCHAFKHFLHGGFGIRQVCDIALFANRYGSRIDWEQVLRNCREIRAAGFAAALLRIGEIYLTFDPEAACLPESWKECSADPEPLLEDLLMSGIYGGSDMTRKHSGNITLHAVAAQKQGKKTRSSAMVSLFPKAKNLEHRYPYLKEKPWLVPLAWTSRIITYGKQGQSRSNNAADSLRLGNARVELLREYGIID